MSDVLLLAGMALCALSVLMAVISVLRMQAPRGAAITLILGILLMFGGAKLSPEPFGVTSLTGAGQRLIDGQIRLGGNPASAPAPAGTMPAETAPAAAAPATTEPATTEPAAAEPAGTAAPGAPSQ